MNCSESGLNGSTKNIASGSSELETEPKDEAKKAVENSEESDSESSTTEDEDVSDSDMSSSSDDSGTESEKWVSWKRTPVLQLKEDDPGKDDPLSLHSLLEDRNKEKSVEPVEKAKNEILRLTKVYEKKERETKTLLKLISMKELELVDVRKKKNEKVFGDGAGGDGMAEIQREDGEIDCGDRSQPVVDVDDKMEINEGEVMLTDIEPLTLTRDDDKEKWKLLQTHTDNIKGLVETSEIVNFAKEYDDIRKNIWKEFVMHGLIGKHLD
jgi:hypothetical protein